MKKIWLIFKYEYVRRVKTRGFIFAVLSMPLLVALAMVMALISVSLQTNKLPAGYVDLSGTLTQPPSQGQSFNIGGDIDLIPFTDVAAGENALAGDEIQALFVIQPDYLQSGAVIAYANERPGDNAIERMREFLRSNLLAGEDAQIQTRITRGSNITVRSLDGSRQASMRDWFVVLFPFLTGLIFIIVINISGGYLLQSVVDEKENRTMEVIVTSVSPEQLMTGKILGNLSVGLTQLLIWLLFAGIGLAGMQTIYGADFIPRPNPRPNCPVCRTDPARLYFDRRADDPGRCQRHGYARSPTGQPDVHPADGGALLVCRCSAAASQPSALGNYEYLSADRRGKHAHARQHRQRAAMANYRCVFTDLAERSGRPETGRARLPPRHAAVPTPHPLQ